MIQRSNEWRRQAMNLSTLLWKRVGLWLSQAKLYIGTVSLVAQISFVFAQSPNCYVLPVSRYDDWQVEDLVGVTDDGTVAGTLVYRGHDSSVRVRRIPFRWSIHRERLEILPLPVNDPEGQYITEIIAQDLSIDGSAIVGKITYSGHNRPSAAFVWKNGTGYQIVKTRRIGSGFNYREVRVPLTAAAVGHSGHHIVIQPQNASSFVIAELPPPPLGQRQRRCYEWYCNEMKVVVPECPYGFLQGDGEGASKELLPEHEPEIHLEMEVFSDTDSQSYRFQQLIPRFDWGNWRRYIPDPDGWLPRRPPSSGVKVLVNDISQDGRWIVGSVVVPAGNYFCYGTIYLQGGEYIMRGTRYSMGYMDECDHYIVEIKFDNDRPIQGRATAIGEYYYESPFFDEFCYGGSAVWCAGLIFKGQIRGQDKDSLFLWSLSRYYDDFYTYRHRHSYNRYYDGFENVVSVRGVDVEGEAVGAGVHYEYDTDTTGYIAKSLLTYLDVWEVMGPIPAVSNCIEAVAISPSGHFVAVKYTDTCDGSPRVFAVIDRRQQFVLQQRLSEVLVAFRNLTSDNRSIPYYSDVIQIRLFLRIGNQWYSKLCDEEARSSRWYITGTADRGSSGEPPPNFTNITTNNRVLSSDILRNLRELPHDMNIYETRWYWLSHEVDREEGLSSLVSQPCRGGGWRRYYYYPPYLSARQNLCILVDCRRNTSFARRCEHSLYPRQQDHELSCWNGSVGGARDLLGVG